MHPKGNPLDAQAAIKTSISAPSFFHSLSAHVKSFYHVTNPATSSEIRNNTCGDVPKEQSAAAAAADCFSSSPDPQPIPRPSSPALTAVEDSIITEEVKPSRHRQRTTRSCLAALLMITMGTSLALTFILIGIGKALGSTSSSSRSNNRNASTTPSEVIIVSSISDRAVAMTATLPWTISTGLAYTSPGEGRQTTVSIIIPSSAIRSGVSAAPTRSPVMSTARTMMAED